MIDNKYNPSKIEEKWYKEWENNKIIEAVLNSEGNKHSLPIVAPVFANKISLG